MAVVPATICPLSLTYVLDQAGRPIIGAQLTVYQAGTTKRAVAYGDASLTSPLVQPIKTTGSGRFPPVYVGAGYFRYRVADVEGAIIDDIDGVEGAVVTQETTTIIDTGSQTPTAALTHFYGTDTPAGWVRANGKTIGNAVSGASEFADATTQALFVQLWNADGTLAVSGGRGNTAIEDFNQGKAIELPDLRRITLIGIDGMGSAYLTQNTLDPHRTLGAVFGEESHTLTIGEMPVHNHVATMDVQGGHIHQASCDIQGTHAHSATADQQGAHAHGATMDVQGGHIHTAAIDAGGAHSHGAVVQAGGDHIHNAASDVQGDHNHQYTRTTYNNDAAVNSNYSTYVRYSEVDYGQNTSNAGSHSHNITIYNGGTHQHGIVVIAVDGHTHGITIAEAGDHQHNITVQVNGQHSHNITVLPSGAHQHNITIADAGEHYHNITMQTTGGGAVHNNMQPSMPVTILIKL